MKKPAVIVLLTLAVSVFLVSGSFAFWRHDAEVKFTLNIAKPEDGEFNCGDYATIQEGIDLLAEIKYFHIYDMMLDFENELEARVVELNNLPFGGITLQELQAECTDYRNVDIAGFGDIINRYGNCINKLADFYRNSSPEEKAQVPDFWNQHSRLWGLHSDLWVKRQDLYNAVDEVWEAGEEKIDYNHGGKKNK